MVGRNPIDRTRLVQCIACKGWVMPDERLRAAFVGGHNVRFHVCHECIAEYRQKRYCRKCGALLTNTNIGLARVKGKRLSKGQQCLTCWGDYVITQRIHKRLIAQYPGIVK